MGFSTVATMLFLLGWLAVIWDVQRTDHRFVRHGPKWCWMIFVVTLPIVGAVAWALFGRPLVAVRRDPLPVGPTGPVVGPEDTPEWAAFVARTAPAD